MIGLGYSARGGSGYNSKNKRSVGSSVGRKKQSGSYSDRIKRLRHQRFLEDKEYEVTPNMTVKQAMKHHFNTFVFDFGVEKWFSFPDWSNEIFKTDHYGHFEADVNSFLAAEAGVDEDTKIGDAEQLIREYLLKHEINSED